MECIYLTLTPLRTKALLKVFLCWFEWFTFIVFGLNIWLNGLRILLDASNTKEMILILTMLQTSKTCIYKKLQVHVCQYTIIDTYIACIDRLLHFVFLNDLFLLPCIDDLVMSYKENLEHNCGDHMRQKSLYSIM